MVDRGIQPEISSSTFEKTWSDEPSNCNRLFSFPKEEVEIEGDTGFLPHLSLADFEIFAADLSLRFSDAGLVLEELACDRGKNLGFELWKSPPLLVLPWKELL